MNEASYRRKGYNQEQAFALSQNPRTKKKKSDPFKNFTSGVIASAREKYKQLKDRFSK